MVKAERSAGFRIGCLTHEVFGRESMTGGGNGQVLKAGRTNHSPRHARGRKGNREEVREER